MQAKAAESQAKAIPAPGESEIAKAETAVAQAEAAGMQAEGATAYADAARASDAVGFEREDAERTLSLTVSYNGGPFCGFARQPGKLTVQG